LSPFNHSTVETPKAPAAEFRFVRSSDLGVSIGRLPRGDRNAITDVEGVAVGHRTRRESDRIRTGVTIVRPHPGNVFERPVPAGAFVLNGFGKSAGLMQVRELGTIETPIALTNTLAVGTAFSALVDHVTSRTDARSVNPLVLECNDGTLNAIEDRPVTEADVHAAIESADASDRSVEEGAIGAGTGMTAFGFKGGIGTASRVVRPIDDEFVVGSIVLANFGDRRDLTVAGVRVGEALPDAVDPSNDPDAVDPSNDADRSDGSIVMLVATDAPLAPRQLTRLAKRAPLGMARTGGNAANGSGDVAVAFSTANRRDRDPTGVTTVETLPDPELDDVFTAAAEATEEAILDALLAAETTTGRDGTVSEAIPIDALRALLRRRGVPTENRE
jgi:D-aminopeptidase